MDIMSWFTNKYPRDCNHELNLDFILSNVNDMITKFLEMETEYKTATERYNAMIKYVRDYFSHLDVTDEVNNKIMEMYNAGLLDDVIESAIKKFRFYEVADMHPYAQVFDRITTGNPLPLTAQGMHICTIGDVPVGAFTLVNSGNTVCQLYLFNILSGELIYQVQDERFKHANSLTYYNGKYYIANETSITTFDYNTHEIDVINFSIPDVSVIHGLDYDYVNDVFVCRGNALDAKRIFTVNTDLTELLRWSNEISYNYNGRYEQSIKFDGEFYYMIDGRTTRDNKGPIGKISVYNQDFKLVSSVLTPTTYELEDIGFYDGDVYFYFYGNSNGFVCKGQIRHTNGLYGTHASLNNIDVVNRFATSAVVYVGWRNNCRFLTDGSQSLPLFAPNFAEYVIYKGLNYVRFTLTEDIGSADFPIDAGFSENAINVKRIDINLNHHVMYGDVFASVNLVRVTDGELHFIQANQYRTNPIYNSANLEVINVTVSNCADKTPIYCTDSLIINNFSSDTTSQFDVTGNFKTRVRYVGVDSLRCSNINFILCNDNVYLNALTTASNDAYNRQTLRDGTDLNSILGSGHYYLTAGLNFLNLPDDSGVYRELDVMQVNTIVRQTISTRGQEPAYHKCYERDIILDGFPNRTFTPIITGWHEVYRYNP